MAVITMRQMLEAGAHFGHQTRRWNPKMKRFIWGERNGIYIIDLEQTLGRVDTAYGFVRDLVAGGGTILFVGTKKQAQDPVRSYDEKCGMPYVNERWLGGMLTNFETMSKRVGKMLEYERMQASGEFDLMIKKEALLLDRELTKLQRNLGGLRNMTKAPDAVFVLDTKKEHIAVTEANKLGIPVVAVVDTNVDPEVVQYPIPGNDDAIRSNGLFARVIADAVEEGRFIANKRNPAPPPPVERTPEEIAEFDAAQTAARAAAAQAQADRDARLAAAKQQTVVAEVEEELAEEIVVDEVILDTLLEEAVVQDAIVEALVEEAAVQDVIVDELIAEGRIEEAREAAGVEAEILEELADELAVEAAIDEAIEVTVLDQAEAVTELDVIIEEEGTEG
jgi:small subunit ribosomal protein S2